MEEAGSSSVQCVGAPPVPTDADAQGVGREQGAALPCRLDGTGHMPLLCWKRFGLWAGATSVAFAAASSVGPYHSHVQCHVRRMPNGNGNDGKASMHVPFMYHIVYCDTDAWCGLHYSCWRLARRVRPCFARRSCASCITQARVALVLWLIGNRHAACCACGRARREQAAQASSASPRAVLFSWCLLSLQSLCSCLRLCISE
jgi:hypothetical protein